MRVLKSRPRISLSIPPEVLPGQSVQAEVALQARREVRIEALAAELICKETVRGGGAVTSQELLRLAAKLLDCPATLPRGTTRYPVRFDLPPWLPPSYAGVLAAVEYTVHIHAPIDWWPDARAEFWMFVGSLPAARAPEQPEVYSTDPDGPQGGEKHFECSLAHTQLAPGDELTGTIALYNVDAQRYSELELAFVAVERAGGPLWTNQVRRYAAGFPLPSLSEGQATPFALRLPRDVWPSIRTRSWQLDWVLEVRAKVPWSSDLVMQIPLRVLPRSSAPSRSATAPATVGSERVQEIWRYVAQTVGLQFDGERLSGSAGEVRLTITREHRGARGTFLVGRLRYPRLGIALDGGLATRFRRVRRGDLALGDPRWDRSHYLTGREAAQVLAFARALTPLPAMVAEIVALDDEELRTERRDAGQSAQTLTDFALRLLALARTIGPARDAIPAPRAMADLVGAWSSAAAELRGELLRTEMGITRAQVDGCAAHITTLWSGEAPRGFSLEVNGRLPIPEARHFQRSAGENGPEPSLPEGARELLRDLARVAQVFTVDTQGVRLVSAVA
jgi:hypothetical protein